MPTVAQYKTGAFSWCDLATSDNDAAKQLGRRACARMNNGY